MKSEYVEYNKDTIYTTLLQMSKEINFILESKGKIWLSQIYEILKITWPYDKEDQLICKDGRSYIYGQIQLETFHGNNSMIIHDLSEN